MRYIRFWAFAIILWVVLCGTSSGQFLGQPRNASLIFGATDASDYNNDIYAAYAATPNKGELFLPAGTYIMTRTLVISDKVVSIRGEGTGTILVGDGFDLITYNSNRVAGKYEWFYVRDITLCNLKSGDDAGNLLTLNNCGGASIRDVGLRGGDTGILLDGCLRINVDHAYTNTQYWSNGAGMSVIGIHAKSSNLGNNANRFSNIEMRSCLRYGMLNEETKSEGGVTIRDSTFEGNKVAALMVTGHNVVQIGSLHVEAKGNDVIVTGCGLVDMSGIVCTETIYFNRDSHVRLTSSSISSVISDDATHGYIDGIRHGTGEIRVKGWEVGYIYNTTGSMTDYASISSPSRNLVPGDLEQWSVGNNAVPAGFGKHGNGLIEKVGNAKYNQFAAKVISQGNTIGLYYRFSKEMYADLLKINGRVNVSFWAKCAAQETAFIGARYRDGTEYYSNRYFTVGKEWSYYSCSIKCDPRASYFDCVIGLYLRPAGSSIDVDGIQINTGSVAVLYDGSKDATASSGGSGISVDEDDIIDRVTEAIKQWIRDGLCGGNNNAPW